MSVVTNKFKCPCGCFLSKGSIKGHLNSERHTMLLKDARKEAKKKLHIEMDELYSNAQKYSSFEYLKFTRNMKERFDNFNFHSEIQNMLSSESNDIEFIEVRNFLRGGWFIVELDHKNMIYNVHSPHNV